MQLSNVVIAGCVLGFCLTSIAAADKEPVTARDFYERGTHRPDSEKELALSDLNKAIELDPNFDAAVWSRAGVLSSLRRYPESIEDYTRYLKRRPGSYSALFNRADANKGAKRFEEAIADYNDILDGDVDFSLTSTPREHAFALSHHYRGNIILEWTKDYDAAIADYTAALELEPGIFQVRVQRAEVYRKLGQFEKAEADYREQIEINPDEASSQWAWQLATCPEDRFRNGERAIQLAQKACETNNWSIPANISILAAAYAEAGKFDDAIKMQTKAIDDNKLEFWKPIFAKRLESFQQSKPLRHDPRVQKPAS